MHSLGTVVLMIYAFVFFLEQINTTKITRTKHNVLLIYVDDLRPLTDEYVHLPNIRKMAANGVTFKNAFAQQALCAPSRNSMLTGRKPDALRLYDFYSYWRNTSGNFTTLPQFFKQNGYETYSVGKVFHPGPSSNFNDDAPYSWSHVYHPPTEKFKDAAVCNDTITNEMHKNLICPVIVEDQPGKSLPDLESLNHSLQILKERNSTKPFFLAVGFYKPHIPLKYPAKYLEKIPIDKIRPPRHPGIPRNLPSVAWQPWTDLRKRDDIQNLNITFPMGIMPMKWTLKIRQSYYAAALYVDDLIGMLMRQVDKRKTIVVLTSDHGWSLGENGLWGKYTNFDAALKVPLIFQIPTMWRKSIETPVEALDIFPTLVELTGLSKTIPKCRNINDKSHLCFDGQSLVPLMQSKQSNYPKAFAISQYPRPSRHPRINTDRPRLKSIKIMGYSIRTKRYRYTEWIKFNNKLFTRNWNKTYGIELYDHLKDDDESNNLRSKPEYKPIQIYLSQLLRSQVDPN